MRDLHHTTFRLFTLIIPCEPSATPYHFTWRSILNVKQVHFVTLRVHEKALLREGSRATLSS